MKAPILSSWFGRGAVAAPPDIESAALRSDRFRLEREGEWLRLEDIINRMERGGLRRITDAEASTDHGVILVDADGEPINLAKP
jgi:hypothetical protein